MSATSAPFGLRPAFFPTGLERAQALANGITSGYASNILKGQPVVYGTTANSGTLGTIIPATTSGTVTGAFAGVEFTDTTGRRRVSNYWPANISTMISRSFMKSKLAVPWRKLHWVMSTT